MVFTDKGLLLPVQQFFGSRREMFTWRHDRSLPAVPVRRKSDLRVDRNILHDNCKAYDTQRELVNQKGFIHVVCDFAINTALSKNEYLKKHIV